MDLRKIKTLIDLVRESGVAELEVNEGEDHLRIVNTHGTASPLPAGTVLTDLSAFSAPAAEQFFQRGFLNKLPCG